MIGKFDEKWNENKWCWEENSEWEYCYTGIGQKMQDLRKDGLEGLQALTDRRPSRIHEDKPPQNLPFSPDHFLTNCFRFLVPYTVYSSGLAVLY